MPSRQILRYIRKQNSGRTTNRQRERILQRSLTKYLNGLDVVFFNDWASGAYLTQGQNTARAALSSNAGWVDLLIAEPRNGKHGLFLELKAEDVVVWRKDGKLRKNEQLYKENAFLERMRHKGYDTDFAVGINEAKDKVNKYLGIPKQEELF